MADLVATVERIVKIGLKIKAAVDTVRHNEEECQEIRKRVLRFSAILSQLQQTGMMNNSPAMSGALEDLEESLQRALELVTSCQEASTIRRLITVGDLLKQLRRVKEDILNKVMLASFAINTHTTIVLLTIQAQPGGHPDPPPRQPEDAAVQISHNSQSPDDFRSELHDVETNLLAGSEGSIAVGPVTICDNVLSFESGHLNLISRPVDKFSFYSLSQILAATNNFSCQNFIGEGGLGVIYKGQLCNGLDIAVKRHKPSAPQGLPEFRAEIEAIENLRHRNVIVLHGICVEGEEKIIVYEYMAKRCLATIIADKTEWNSVNWTKRLQIIQGIANGLAYLHDGHPQMCIVHRDIKPGNILLDHEMNAKITDFGLAVMLNPEMPLEVDLPVCGTIGYAAPEYIATGEISPKQDVYGFGIVLLEIMCRELFRSYIRKRGIKPRGITPPGLSLHQYAQKYQTKLQKFVDPILRAEKHEMAEIMKCIQVALLCIHDHARNRPTMSEHYTTTLQQHWTAVAKA